MITQLSNINIKLNLETFFTIRFLILLLGSTSIPLGKSGKISHIWQFFVLKWQIYEVVVIAKNNLPPPCYLTCANDSYCCHPSATQQFINTCWHWLYSVGTRTPTPHSLCSYSQKQLLSRGRNNCVKRKALLFAQNGRKLTLPAGFTKKKTKFAQKL